MQSPANRFEMVRVTGECRLLDADSVEHVYWRRDGKALAVGHYVVGWPPGIVGRRFNEDAIFHGPFRLRIEAETSLEELRARRLTA
jgi:hypothetical protein